MDSAIGFFMFLLVLLVFVALLGYLYKRRVAIKQWLDVPYYAQDDRKLKLKREIEDAQEELADIEKAEVER